MHPAAPDAAHKHRRRAGRQQGTANRVVGQEEGLRAKALVARCGCRQAGTEEGEGARFLACATTSTASAIKQSSYAAAIHRPFAVHMVFNEMPDK
jgi:hypothetical protein